MPDGQQPCAPEPHDTGPAPNAPATHSPCIGVCRLDEDTGYCLGCGRTGAEIAEWGGADDLRKAAIWQMLPARLKTLGTKARLLPWSPHQIGAWVAERLSASSGSWVVGISGAIAEFPCGPEVVVDGANAPTTVTARRPDGAFRLEVHDKLRALAFGADPASSVVVLALPRTRVALPVRATLTPLGPDTRAIHAEHRAMTLFDIGLGRSSFCFCVRATATSEFARKLELAAHQPWLTAFGEIGALLFDASPHRVVETALARAEVYSPIPRPGARSPDGAHTHLLPGFLNPGSDSPSGLALPDSVTPIAIFYPASDTGHEAE